MNLKSSSLVSMSYAELTASFFGLVQERRLLESRLAIMQGLYTYSSHFFGLKGSLCRTRGTDGPATQNSEGMDQKYMPLKEDVPREEEPWLDDHEALIHQWRQTSDTLSKKHEDAGYAAKRKHTRFGLPAMLIPMVMAPMTPLFSSHWSTVYVESVGFVLSAVASGMVQFFNFAGKSERHFNFSARYADLVTDIEQELAKPRQYRQQVDTFSLRVKMMFDALNRHAPTL